MTKVSVIIPAFNCMAYLPFAINSVLKQTFQSWEVIIVNDGSTDHIERWFDTLGNPKIKLINQLNQGSAVARNTGLSNASGEYIAFLDGDDIWVPSKLNEQVSILDRRPEVGLVYSWVGSIDAKHNITGKIRKNSYRGNVFKDIAKHDIIECGSTPMIRRSCFDTVGNFDPALSYAQVWDMWIRIAARYEFDVIEKPLIYYRHHPENYSKNWHRIEKNCSLIIEKNLSQLPQDLQFLKQQAYSLTYLRIAWKIFQDKKSVVREVVEYKARATKTFPKSQFSNENVRLTIAILVVKWLGFSKYETIRGYLHIAKNKILNSFSRRFDLKDG
jgi:glycosyltransferase involved in cell wall biosynthesis